MNAMKRNKVEIEKEDGTELTEEEAVLITDQELEIEAAGVDITKIVVRSGGSPMRFHIKFRAGEPSAEARRRLEEARYDVGQNLAGKDLSFYVVRRVKQTEGWSV